MASVLQILKHLNKTTASGETIWVSKVDGNSNKVSGEIISFTPEIGITEVGANNNIEILSAIVNLEKSGLVSNTFSAKIVVAGEENQLAIQVDGNSNLVLYDLGNIAVKVTSAKLDINQGIVNLKWADSNGWDYNYQLIASYDYIKKDSVLGNLGQIYSYGNTPWNISSGKGCAVINSPRTPQSTVKVLKFITYNEGAIDWMIEPDANSSEGKELSNLFNTITKQVSEDFGAFIGL